VSASKKKQARKGTDETLQQNTPQETRSHGALYAIAGVIVVIVVAAVLIWNSNFFQNRAAAVTINGVEYSAADVNYYYFNNAQSGAYYYSMMGLYDPAKAPEDQIFEESSGMTWRDYFLEQSIENLRQEVALAAEAEKAGMTLSEENLATIEQAKLELEAGRVSYGYANVDAYLKANLGSSMTYDKYIKCVERSALATQYSNAFAETLTVDQAELDEYYLENKNTVDTYVTTLFQFQARVETTDAEGNPIEMTEEETAAALDSAKQAVKAKAEALLARLEAGEDAEALAEEFADDLAYSSISQRTLGSSLNTNLTQWLFDAARSNGDAALIDYSSSATLHTYSVVRLEDRFLDDQATADIRHILVDAGAEPTQDEYAAALAEAEALVEDWKAAGSSEDVFAQMATEHSADTSSAANGGLLNVSTYDGYGQPFVDWALASERKSGDVGFVKNDFSVTKGYHIMYYVDAAAPYWQQMAESAILNVEYSMWQEEIMAGYPAEQADGIKYVG